MSALLPLAPDFPYFSYLYPVSSRPVSRVWEQTGPVITSNQCTVYTQDHFLSESFVTALTADQLPLTMLPQQISSNICCLFVDSF